MTATRTVLLWVHALIGAGWIGGCACFVLAALVLAGGGEDRREFAARVAPPINRIGLAAAVLVPVSGAANFYIVGAMRNFRFSQAFISVLSAKIALYLAMVAALVMAIRTEPRLTSTASTRAIDRLTATYSATVMLGGAALVLGLWLVGS